MNIIMPMSSISVSTGGTSAPGCERISIRFTAPSVSSGSGSWKRKGTTGSSGRKSSTGVMMACSRVQFGIAFLTMG